MKTYLIYKVIRKVYYTIKKVIDTIISTIVFFGNNVSYISFKTNGIPYISVAIGGICNIGKNFRMNNGSSGNPIGCYERCTLFVDKNAILTIGNNVGISQTALICHSKIDIGDNVKIGGGVCIYDTDFHSINFNLRISIETDMVNKITKPVIIENNVFIGAKSLILKGVTVGENSVIGAGSVVTKSIPANQIWAGNPAKLIRSL